MFKFLATFFLILLLSFSFSLPSFVAVGTGGIIASSDDGASWVASSNSQSVFDNNIIRGIAFNGSNKFVAVGLGLHTAFSSDGDTWAKSEDIALSGYSVTYCNGNFYQGGAGGKVAYSSDGNNWTFSSDYSAFEGNVIFGITCDSVSGLLVAVTGVGGIIAFSYDGDTWYRSYNDTTIFGTSALYSVTWNGTIFVATSGSGIIAFSYDGDTWARSYNDTTIFGTQTNASVRGNIWSAISGLFVGGGATGRIGFSSDGDTWYRSYNDTTIFGTATFISGMAYNSDIYTFVGVGNYGKAGFSYDGDTWYASTGDYNSQSVFGSGVTNYIYGVVAPVVSYAPPDPCSPVYNEDWVVSELTECTDATIDIGTGILYLNVVGKLVLTNSNVTASSLVLIDSGVEIWLSSGSWLKVG